MAPNNPHDLMIESSDRARTARTYQDMWKLAAERADRCACFFDFDGTLAQIADDPEAVAPVPGALEALSDLADRVRRVVVVSARPVHFLRRHLTGLPQVALFGLYGLEWQIGSGPVNTLAEARPFESIMKGIADRARNELPADVLIEYKRLSVALHYRAAPELREQVEKWATVATDDYGLHAQPGRMVVELKPPVDRDKGSVVAEEIGGLSCAWYFGDDLSDLRAFAALDDRQATDASFVGVKVSVANPESGHELRPAADLCIDSPERVPEFLTGMIAAISQRPAR